MYRGVGDTPGSFDSGIGSAQGPVFSSAIGKINTVFGSVTIARSNANAIQPAVGDFVYEGDLIETGIDGQVGIVFVDGTTFQLSANASVVLDEFIYDAENSSNSAVLRVGKGMFGFVAGKVATTGRLIIDTPLAKIQNTPSAASIGSLAFIFVLGLVQELEASSLNVAVLNDDLITYKDLQHGIYEILVRQGPGLPPRVIIVDDPGETIILRIGTSGVIVDHVANTPAQMAQLQIAYQNVYSTYSQGQQDPFIQHLEQQGTNPEQHANAGQQSTGSTSSSGSSTPPDVISPTGGTTAQNNPPPSNGPDNTNTTPPITPVVFTPPPLATTTFSGPPTIPATIITLPISSNDLQHAVFIGPSNALNPNVALNITVPAGETLDSVNITGLPPGGTITDGNGNVHTGNDITLSAADFQSGLTLSGSPPASGTLIITATVTGPGGPATSSADLQLTGDLQPPPSGPPDLTQRWINPSGGDWNVATNWSTGAVPIPHQDVVIDLGGNYDIFSSSSVSIDSLLISNAGVTLHITGGSFSLTTADAAPLSNAGNVVVGSGAHLTIGQPAFANSVLNSGKLEVNGGTLDLVNVTVNNAGGTTQVDVSSTLNLAGAIINDGILTVAGLFNSTGTSSITDAAIAITSTGTLKSSSGLLTIDPSTIDNAGTLEAAGGELDLNDISSFINSGLLLATSNSLLVLNGDTVTNSGTVRADAGSTVDLQATTISGGTVTNDGLLEASGGTSSTIENATSFTNSGELLATGSGTTFVLESETVTNTGSVQVNAGATLDLVGAIVHGGTLSNGGLLEATGGVSSTIENVTSFANSGELLATGSGTTLVLKSETVTNTGSVQVNAGATLDLVGAIVHGGTVGNGGLLEATGGVSSTIENVTSFANSGELLATGSGTTLVLKSETVTNTGSVQVNAGAILDLVGAIVHGGTVSNAGLMEAIAGTSNTIENATSFTNSGELLVTGAGTALVLKSETVTNSGSVQVDIGTTLNLMSAFISGGTVINSALLEATSGASGIGGATITNNTAATIEATGAGVTLTIGPSSTVTNNGLMEAISGGDLIFKTATVANASGTVEVADASSKIELQGASITGGTVINFGLLEGTSGASAIHTATSITNHTGATLGVTGAGVTLTIDNAGTFTNEGELLSTAQGDLILINDTVTNAGGTVQVDANSTLDLHTTTINNGTFINSGLFEATVGANVIHAADSITNNTGATLEVTGVGVTLTIDNAGTFTNHGKLLSTAQGDMILINDTVANAGGTVQVDANSTLDLHTVTFNNGTFINSGLFEATVGANVIHAATSITNNTGATLEVTGVGVTLTIDNAGTFTNHGKLLSTGQGDLILISDTVANSGGTVQVDTNSTLDLHTVTIDNGSIVNHGLLEATFGANIISHVNDDGPGGEVFSNDGKLLVTGEDTKLTLNTDVVDNSSGSRAGRRRQHGGAQPDPGAQDSHHRQRQHCQSRPVGGDLRRQHHLACQRRRAGRRGVQQRRRALGDRRRHQADARYRRARQLRRSRAGRRRQHGGAQPDPGAQDSHHRQRQHCQSRPVGGDLRRQHHLACQRRRAGRRGVQQRRRALGDRRRHQADARYRRARQLRRSRAGRRRQHGGAQPDPGAQDSHHRQRQHCQSRPVGGDLRRQHHLACQRRRAGR